MTTATSSGTAARSTLRADRPTGSVGVDDVLARSSDPVGRWVAAAAVLASVVASAWYQHRGDVLLYWDSVSHLEIARRVLESPTPGLGQLGGVWLPLPHLLMLPFAWSRALYFDGLAGSLVSMGAYVVTAVLLHKTARDLTGSTGAGVVAALVFMSNPNVLYMQSTPMTELLLFACVAGMVHGVQRWVGTGDGADLLRAATAGLLGTLTRYEAWVLLAALAVVVAVVGWRRRGRVYAEGTTLAFLSVAGLGIVLWLGWDLLMFGDPLEFHGGRYATPSLWVDRHEVAVGHWGTALRTYAWATVDDLGWAVTILGLLGLATAVVLAVRRHRALHVLPLLSLLAFFAFFVIAVEQGQRPLHVEQVSGQEYNVRFGLLMVLPAALSTGCLLALVRGAAAQVAGAVLLVAVAVGASAVTWSAPGGVVTLAEPASTLHDDPLARDSTDVGTWLRAHYTGGRLLMQSFSNELVLPRAHIATDENVYEGSYRLWGRSLRDPAAEHVRWVVMRTGHQSSERDEVDERLGTSPRLRAYDLVYDAHGYRVYELAAARAAG